MYLVLADYWSKIRGDENSYASSFDFNINVRNKIFPFISKAIDEGY